MLIALLNALGFRARGGLGEKWGWRIAEWLYGFYLGLMLDLLA